MLKQLLEPKDEVLTGRLQGVIDIERVADSKRRALESRPRDFLQSTYASGEIRRLVESINKRLNSADAETGLFLAEGPKGVAMGGSLNQARHRGDARFARFAQKSTLSC